jgi:hypothetical protein
MTSRAGAFCCTIERKNFRKSREVFPINENLLQLHVCAMCLVTALEDEQGRDRLPAIIISSLSPAVAILPSTHV